MCTSLPTVLKVWETTRHAKLTSGLVGALERCKYCTSLTNQSCTLPTQERSYSAQSGDSSNASHHAARSIEANAPLIRSIFVEESHPAYPLLDADLARSEKQSRLMAVAIAIITKYTSPELQGLHNNVLIEEFTSTLLLAARSPALETVEAAILFTQRALRGRM